jgi:hypothetical protein
LEAELTGKSWVWSERSEEGRSGGISPVTSQEEVDVVAAVTNPDSIPSLQMERTTRRTST